MVSRKKPRISYNLNNKKSDSFDKLPDDLVISILSKLSFSSSSPSDFFNALLVCKRFSRLGMNKVVLSKACSGVLAIKAKNWSESAHRFLKLCVCAGSVEAAYFLGMIRFYCLDNRGIGRSLMAKAAIKSHAPALYSLAVIQFNGSGGTKSDKDLRAGVALCARAAYLGHVDAHRELGHCIQDGYGIKQNVSEGRRLLIQANARELASVLPHLCSAKGKKGAGKFGAGYSTLLSDYGCNVPAPEPHPANRFLVDWFESRELGPDTRLCSHAGCGRPETRPHEFRRCSVCGTVNYCSRGCQAIDWKLRHKAVCTPMGLGLDLGVVGEAPVNEAHQVPT
ncbi:F-box protein At1g67340-like [Silene latifolia]|uniref:F-box protein At1g67340-like n=1 Tax=Silene latifolia TaxID=37657 RepID=UPI003D782C28